MSPTDDHDRVTMDLAAYGAPYGSASVLATSCGLVSVILGLGRGGVTIDCVLSPDCAQDLAYALMEQATLAKLEGGAA